MADLPKLDHSLHHEPQRGGWHWPVVAIVVVLILAGMYIYTLKQGKWYIETVGHGGLLMLEKSVQIAENLQKQNINQTFHASIPQFDSKGPGNLEVATLHSSEVFSVTDSKTLFSDWVYLGTSKAEIRVPVTYRFHVSFADEWVLDVSGQTCIVMAPQVKPSLPPAIHTDRIEKNAESGWARFNKDKLMADLERSMTPTLNRNAQSEKYLSLVREQARKTVAEYVKLWLLAQDHWRDDRYYAIVVIFSDEKELDPDELQPIIELERKPPPG